MDKIQAKFGEAVVLTWHDSRALTGWQYNPTKAREVGVIRSLGRVVQTSDYGITITSSINDHATIDDLTIPWGAIVEIDPIPDYSL